MKVNKKHIDQIKKVFGSRSEVLSVYLYGSHARGEAGSLSDVDIGVLVDERKFEKGKSVDGYRLDYIGMVMDVFMSDDVDVQVVSHDTPLVFAYNVTSEGKRLISNNDDLVIERETEILSKYMDFAYFEHKFFYSCAGGY